MCALGMPMLLDIQVNTHRLRELESARRAHDRRLSELRLERQDYLQSLHSRNDLLANQILAAYRLGRESRLKTCTAGRKREL